MNSYFSDLFGRFTDVLHRRQFTATATTDRYYKSSKCTSANATVIVVLLPPIRIRIPGGEGAGAGGIRGIINTTPTTGRRKRSESQKQQ